MAFHTLEQRFGQLEKAKETPQNSSPKIQRVVSNLRDRKDFEKYYFPKFLSIGPIHHGDANLQKGEQYKLRWAAKYIESTGRYPQDLHKRIADNIGQLKGMFAEDLLNCMSSGLYTWQMEEKLSWMLFVDGCALLHILEKAKLNEPDQMNVKVDQLFLVMTDVLLLENQIPYLVLKLLWRNGNESALIRTMWNFPKCHHWSTEKQHSTVVEVEFVELRFPHLLGLQRRIILAADSSPKINVGNQANKNKQIQNNSDIVRYRNIQELKAAGIRLKSSKTRRPRDVSFSHGWLAAELTLPQIVVDDTTAATFLNLIAYEMCPDFTKDSEICSLVAFMDSLIDHPEDVKALRSAGILDNSLGSDEEVANLFNIISTDLVLDTLMYYHVSAEIEKYYRRKLKTWIAMGFDTYFSNPWAIIAFFAALLALALTLMQTWFAIHPPKS